MKKSIHEKFDKWRQKIKRGEDGYELLSWSTKEPYNFFATSSGTFETKSFEIYININKKNYHFSSSDVTKCTEYEGPCEIYFRKEKECIINLGGDLFQITDDEEKDKINFCIYFECSSLCFLYICKNNKLIGLMPTVLPKDAIEGKYSILSRYICEFDEIYGVRESEVDENE